MPRGSSSSRVSGAATRATRTRSSTPAAAAGTSGRRAARASAHTGSAAAGATSAGIGVHEHGDVPQQRAERDAPGDRPCGERCRQDDVCCAREDEHTCDLDVAAACDQELRDEVDRLVVEQGEREQGGNPAGSRRSPRRPSPRRADRGSGAAAGRKRRQPPCRPRSPASRSRRWRSSSPAPSCSASAGYSRLVPTLLRPNACEQPRRDRVEGGRLRPQHNADHDDVRREHDLVRDVDEEV